MSQILGQQGYIPEREEFNLADIVNYLLKYRWLILMVTLFTFGLGIFYASRQIPQYQSDILLQIDSNQSNMGGAGVSAPQFLFNTSANEATSKQIALMQSRFILEPVIKTLGLDIGATIKKNGMWAGLTSFRKKTIKVSLFEVPQTQNNRAFNLVFDRLGHVRVHDATGHLLLHGAINTLITNADKSIRLRVDAIAAPIGTTFTLVKKSALPIVKSLAHQLIIEESGSSGRMSQKNTGILTVSLNGADPDKITRILNTVANVTMLKDAQKKSQEAAKTLEFLYHQLPITEGQLKNAETALNRYRADSGKIDIKIQTTFLLGQLGELDKQLGELSIHKIDMLQHYTQSHPTLKALLTQIRALEAQRKQLESRIKTLPASDQIAVNLMRDVNVKKTLYLILLTKIQDLNVVKAGTVSSVHILSEASVPDKPLPGKRAPIYLSSLLLGLVVSGIIIFGRQLIAPRVDDPHWSERQFNLANLAIIPYCKEQTVNGAKFKAHESEKMPLLAHANPRNLSIESLRSLRTSLQVTLACASNNIISILGVSPGVGKSFVSSNLAYLLASGGKRVLLIDGDLRKGTLHIGMNSKPVPGLADILNETVTCEHALIQSVHKNLDFIPRGAYPADPSELLMSEGFKTLITTLSKQYDVVLIDTAPVLLVTDAVLIGALSATNFLVMGAGSHQPSEVELVLKRLTSSGIQVSGTVFNFYRAETLSRTYGKYGKYGKYNTYYSDEPV